jgi:hypothetical protein
VNSGDFNSNLAQYAAIAGATDLQTASMEGLESAEVLAESAPEPEEADTKKPASKVALIAGVAGGAAALLLAGGYVWWVKSASDASVVPMNDPDAQHKSSQMTVNAH